MFNRSEINSRKMLKTDGMCRERIVSASFFLILGLRAKLSDRYSRTRYNVPKVTVPEKIFTKISFMQGFFADYFFGQIISALQSL